MFSIVFGIIGLFLFNYNSNSSSSRPNFKNIGKAKYYNDPRYWDLYYYYRNDEVTKYYDPAINNSAVIYGKWKSAKKAYFNVKEGPEGLRGIKKFGVGDYSNDSILTISYKFDKKNLETTKHHFDMDGKVAKIEFLTSNYDWTYKYVNNFISQLTVYSSDKLFERWNFDYSDNSGYKIVVYDKKGDMQMEQSIQNNFKGIPISYEGREFSKKNKSLELTVKENYSYKNYDQIIDIEYLKTNTTARIFESIGKNKLTGEEKNLKSGKITTFYNKQHSDKHNNWIVNIHYENSIVINIALREIIYENGEVSGSIDPQNAIVKQTLDSLLSRSPQQLKF